MTRASVPRCRPSRRPTRPRAAVMVTSHLGRPTEGTYRAEDSLAPIAKRLSELLGFDVPLISDWVDGVQVAPGQVVLLENCRFNRGEKKDDPVLAKKLAALCDVFVMDAFGTAHRAKSPPTAWRSSRLSPVPARCSRPNSTRWARRCDNPAPAARHRCRLQGVHQADHSAFFVRKVDQLIVGGGIANTFIAASGIDRQARCTSRTWSTGAIVLAGCQCARRARAAAR
jgi:phosphoglycerate kinase